MLDLATAAICIRAAILVAILLLVLRYALLPTLNDGFRQDLFDLRRRIFLLRVDGVLSPADRAYRILMKQINASIRFADAMTFGRWLVVAIATRPSPSAYDDFEIALASLPDETRRVLVAAHEEFEYQAAKHIFVTSPLAWALTLVALPFVCSYLLGKGLGKEVGRRAMAKRFASRPAFRRIESDVSEMLPEDEAALAA
jgi:hypothetical protein